MVSHLISGSPIRRGIRYQPAFKIYTGAWIPLTQSRKSLFQHIAVAAVQKKLASMDLNQIISSPINNSDSTEEGSTAVTSATMSPSPSPPSPLGKRRRDQISETEDSDVSIRSHHIAADNLEPSPKRHQSSKKSSRVTDNISQGHQSPKSSQHISRVYRTLKSNSRVTRDAHHINALTKSLNDLHISSSYARYFHQVCRDRNGIKTIFGISLPAENDNPEIKINADKNSTLGTGTAQTRHNSPAQTSSSSKNNAAKSKTSTTKKSTQSKVAAAAQPLSTSKNNANRNNAKPMVVSTQDAASMDDYQYALATGRIRPNQTTLAVTPAPMQPSRYRCRPNGTANTDYFDKLKVVEDEQPHMNTPNHRIANPTKSHLKVNKPQPGQPRGPKRKIAFSENICVYVENTHYPQDDDRQRIRQFRQMISDNRLTRRIERSFDSYHREKRSVDPSDDDVNVPTPSGSRISARIAEMLEQQRLDYAAKKREEYEEAYLTPLQAWKVGYEKREKGYPLNFPAVLKARDRTGVRRVTLARWRDGVKRSGKYF